MDNLEGHCNSSNTNKLSPALIKSTNTYTVAESNTVVETMKHSLNAPNVSIHPMSTSDMCFQALTEADQATSRPFCNQRDANSPLCKHQTSDDNSRPFYVHQTSENSLLKMEYMNDNKPGYYQRESSRTDTSLESVLIDGARDASFCNTTQANSAQLNTDTATTLQANFEFGTDVQQQDLCDLIELSRQSLFADPRTGERYLVVYGSSDAQNNSCLTDNEKESPRCYTRRQGSSESTDDFEILNDSSIGSPSIINPYSSLSQQASEKQFFYKCNRDETVCRGRNTGSAFPQDSNNICSYSHDVIGNVQIPDVQTVQNLHDKVYQRAQSNPDFSPLRATIPDKVYGQTQPFSASVCEQMKPFAGFTESEQTCQCKNEHFDSEKLSKSYPGFFPDKMKPKIVSTKSNDHIRDQGDLVDHPTESASHTRNSGQNRELDHPTTPSFFRWLTGFNNKTKTSSHVFPRGSVPTQSSIKSQTQNAQSRLRIQCVVCQKSIKRNLSLQENVSITSYTDTITTTAHTGTPSNSRAYRKSLSTHEVVKHHADHEKVNNFATANETHLQLIAKTSIQCKTGRVDSDTQPSNSLKSFEKFSESQRDQNESKSSYCGNEKQKTYQRDDTNYDRYGFHDEFRNSSGGPESKNSFEGKQITKGLPMRSVSHKNYLAYLCCAKDNLSSFGLPFHRMLEQWGLSIFLEERDLELGGPKYETMAKCVEERCNGKIIVVLSKSYMNSDECLFLTYFAKTLDPDSKRKNIIPVLIDKNVEIPSVLQGVSLIKYNYVYTCGWLKDKMIRAIAA